MTEIPLTDERLPGPELDARVAELMGWTLTGQVLATLDELEEDAVRHRHSGQLSNADDPPGSEVYSSGVRKSDWNPSTDIRDAMVVVEWMYGEGFLFECRQTVSGRWLARFRLWTNNAFDTLAHAICLAALEACK
jgi:hypothetical protein